MVRSSSTSMTCSTMRLWASWTEEKSVLSPAASLPSCSKTLITSERPGVGRLMGRQTLPKVSRMVSTSRFEIELCVVDLVDDDHAREATLAGDGHEAARGGFDASGQVDDDGDGLDRGHARDGVPEEVGPARGVDEVDVVILELEVCEGRVDGVLVVFFFVGEIAHGGAGVDRSHPLDHAAGKEEAFGQCCLSAPRAAAEKDVAGVSRGARCRYSHGEQTSLRVVRVGTRDAFRKREAASSSVPDYTRCGLVRSGPPCRCSQCTARRGGGKRFFSACEKSRHAAIRKLFACAVHVRRERSFSGARSARCIATRRYRPSSRSSCPPRANGLRTKPELPRLGPGAAFPRAWSA
jgi:hypothetical protein